MSKPNVQPAPLLVSLFVVVLLSYSGVVASRVIPQSATVDLKPIHVVVHQVSAEVTSTGTVQLTAGSHYLKFPRLTSAGDNQRIREEEESIQLLVNGKPVHRIEWVSELAYPQLQSRRVELGQLRETLEAQLNLEIAQRSAHNENLKYTSTLEARWLHRIEAKGSTAETDMDDGRLHISVEHLSRQRVMASTEIARLDRSIYNLTAALRSLQVESSQVESVRWMPQIQVRVATCGEVSIQAVCIIRRSNWRPSYDIHVDSRRSELHVSYYAMVLQETQQDWDGVDVTISTAVPTHDRKIPKLEPQQIGVRTPKPKPLPVKPIPRSPCPVCDCGHTFSGSHSASLSATITPPKDITRSHAIIYAASTEKPKIAVLEAEDDREPVVQEFGLSNSYSLSGKASIFSGEEIRIRIASMVLPVNLTYIAVPKLSTKVFLRGDVINNSSYTLLPGPALLYSDSVLVGEVDMPLLGFMANLSLELGTDPRLTVKVQPGPTVIDVVKPLFGASIRKESTVQRFSVSSTKPEGVAVRVSHSAAMVKLQDADKIRVSLHEPFCPDPLVLGRNISTPFQFPRQSNVTMDATGTLTWAVWVPAGSTEEIHFRYSTERDEQLALDYVSGP